MCLKKGGQKFQSKWGVIIYLKMLYDGIFYKVMYILKCKQVWNLINYSRNWNILLFE